MDVVQRRALAANRRGLLSEPLPDWLARLFGRAPADLAPFERALTHGSAADDNYERLEFLGDRVLGLTIAEWLFELFPGEPEGDLSKRLNALVDGQTCAEVARGWGVGAQLRLGKQAQGDGASDSDHVLGDVAESLIGAWYREAGWEAARAFVRSAWGERITSERRAPQHPKSALQEWSERHHCGLPVYSVVEEDGADHARRYTIRVRVGDRGEQEATGATKREAETAAAATLLGALEAAAPQRKRRRGTATASGRRTR